jgi:hypothetical protein
MSPNHAKFRGSIVLMYLCACIAHRGREFKYHIGNGTGLHGGGRIVYRPARFEHIGAYLHRHT